MAADGTSGGGGGGRAAGGEVDGAEVGGLVAADGRDLCLGVRKLGAAGCDWDLGVENTGASDGIRGEGGGGIV